MLAPIAIMLAFCHVDGAKLLQFVNNQKILKQKDSFISVIVAL